ncbi:toxin-antitoxin system YwqK family antitoxin [Pyxidicoccus sp. 3LFB2]
MQLTLDGRQLPLLAAPGARRRPVDAEQVRARWAKLGQTLPWLVDARRDHAPSAAVGPEDYQRFVAEAGTPMLAPFETLLLSRCLPFDARGTFQLFAAAPYANGINGQAFGPSRWRPETVVWRVEAGVLQEEEGSFSEWLADWLDRFDALLGQVRPEQYPALADVNRETEGRILGDLPEGTRPLTDEEPGVTGWQGPTEDGRREGLWRHHHQGGPVDEELTYHQGLRQGPARRWHVTDFFPESPESEDPDAEPGFKQGPLQEEGAFAEDAAEGPWSFWTPEGARASRGTYRRGLPHGTWEVFPGPGSVIGLTGTSEVDYVHGLPHAVRLAPSGYDVPVLVAADGRPCSLRELARGRPLVVLVWQREAPPTPETLPTNLWEQLRALDARGAARVGLTARSPLTVARDTDALEFLADPSGVVRAAYHYLQRPDTSGLLLLDASGGYLGSGHQLPKRLQDLVRRLGL